MTMARFFINRMKILWVIGILIIFAVSCINRVNSYYWEETGDFKTNIVYFSQSLRTVNDSDILEQVYLNKKTLLFVFGKSHKNELFVQGFRRPNPPPPGLGTTANVYNFHFRYNHLPEPAKF